MLDDPPDVREALSPKEFVAKSGLSLATVRRYLRDGRLPSIQPGGRRCRVLIPASALALVSAVNAEPRSAVTNGPRDVAAVKQPSTLNKALPGRKAEWRSYI